MKPNETQLSTIRKHLLRQKSITSWEAIQKYRITRLSQYVLLLRKEGYVIVSQWINPKKGNKFVKYNLIVKK